jgi:hypothetical protein
MCRRTKHGGVASGLAIRDLSTTDIRAIFTSEFLRQLRQIDLCGVHGDPVAARSFNAAVDWFTVANSALRIEVYTNGALRPGRWWRELARRYQTLRVVFAIDGLEDTHAFYRRGTSFEKVVENARAFISAGGERSGIFWFFATTSIRSMRRRSARTNGALMRSYQNLAGDSTAAITKMMRNSRPARSGAASQFTMALTK